MKITFLGVGGAFNPQWGSSAAYLETNKIKMLIDCGSTTYGDLVEAQLADVITHVIITHMHDDHIGSLSAFLFHKFFIDQQKITLICPRKLQYQLETYLAMQMTNYPLPHYFDLLVFDDEVVIGDLTIYAIDTYNKHQLGMQTFGYIFQDDEQDTIAYSGDLAKAEAILCPLEMMIVLEQAKSDKIQVFHDLNFIPEAAYVHAYYTTLEPWLERFPKIFGYHHNPLLTPSVCRVKSVALCPEFLTTNRWAKCQVLLSQNSAVTKVP